MQIKCISLSFFFVFLIQQINIGKCKEWAKGRKNQNIKVNLIEYIFTN